MFRFRFWFVLLHADNPLIFKFGTVTDCFSVSTESDWVFNWNCVLGAVSFQKSTYALPFFSLKIIHVPLKFLTNLEACSEEGRWIIYRIIVKFNYKRHLSLWNIFKSSLDGFKIRRRFFVKANRANDLSNSGVFSANYRRTSNLHIIVTKNWINWLQ